MRTSAGLLLYRRHVGGGWELLLVHPGGPFWARKDASVWSIPKGEFGSSEDPHDAAVREFTEELGAPPPALHPGATDLDLGAVKQSSAKTVLVYARGGDFDADHIVSNVIEIEWPPRSGRKAEIPEVDRAGWYGVEEARVKLLKGQVPFIDRLLDRLRDPVRSGPGIGSGLTGEQREGA